MYFHAAGIETAPWIPPLVAFGISFFTSMGGVSGAFLLLPFQMSFLGYTNPSVSATNQLYNIIAIPSGVYRYCREGRMVWPLTWAVILGTLPGVFLGALARVIYLPNPLHFKLFVALVLFYIGMRMARDIIRARSAGEDKTSSEERFQELIRRHRRCNANKAEAETLPAVKVTRFDLKRIEYYFYNERHEIPTGGILTLSFVVGIIGGAYGIGGGSIIAPFFVSFFHLPVYTVAGAALMGTFVTSIAGVGFFHALAPFFPDMSVAPDWPLGILFGIGGMGGMYAGAWFQKFVPAKAIKTMLAAVLLFTAAKYMAAVWGW
ncbi:MAG: sulfite exporter TauE/SafE family protein [Candidatus Omnitrophota bacterium]|nr:MAG: sulfite exporter TauE/SafE family protein [Candidatus Omnitrophota bacterium]